ncbi:MAG: caspase family protein [Spirochaetes bacterium]|nr:caspase family protein [Spirochaetota bacterium]
MKNYFLIVLLILANFLPIRISGSVSLRRLAIFVGANYGGPDRKKLKYAISDAREVERVFKEMGGILSSDEVLLIEPKKRELVKEIENFQAKVDELKEKHNRMEFIFYYSGHSDEEGILLGREKFYYQDLKNKIKGIKADMNIVILDSCSSGALTRVKGGKKYAPFLVDSSIDVKGYAILTSSSSEEVSQESDRIGGSFFTHYLVSGLRGAADNTGDGRVTLNEVYQYTYHETLAKTEKTISGPQHPNYDIQMTGSGDVIITDVKENSAGLILMKDSYGKYYIRNERERLVAEINKQKGKTVEIGLEPGEYSIALERNKNYYTGIVDLDEGMFLKLNDRSLKPEKKEYAVSRGGTEEGEESGEQVLISKPIHDFDHGGFGGPAVKMGFVNGSARLLVGGRGAWIIDHKLSLGGAGYGMISQLNRTVDSTNREFKIGYGGFEIGYINRSDALIHWNFITLIGAGGISYVNPDEKENQHKFFADNGTTSTFFALEPMFYVEFNIAKWFRLCLGGGYHYFSIVKGKQYFQPGELSGPSAELVFKFGRF